MSSYTEQYKDPRWQKKRLEIMDRDGFACCHCRDKQTTLNVHHSFYEKGRKIWDYEASYLVTLCEDCHGKFHLLIKNISIKASLFMDFRGALVTLNKQGLLPKFSEQIIGLGELVEAAEDLVNSQHEDFHAAPNA